jgi:DNA-binding transcriptional ArsR family regulator
MLGERSTMTKVFFMSELFESINDLSSPDLVTRHLGSQAYDILRKSLNAINQGETLVLNFEGVRVMDSSFAGASVLKLLSELVDGVFGNKYIIIAKATPSTEENLHLTIVGHGLKLALQAVGGQDGYRFLGQLEPNLRETLQLLNQRDTLTARDLADLKGDMAINTASNRLKKLYDLRLARRVEEITATGRQHVYQAVTA